MQNRRGELFQRFLDGKPIPMSRDAARDLEVLRPLEPHPEEPKRQRSSKATKPIRRAIVRILVEHTPRGDAIELASQLAKRKTQPGPTSDGDFAVFTSSLLAQWYRADELERLLKRLGGTRPRAAQRRTRDARAHGPARERASQSRATDPVPRSPEARPAQKRISLGPISLDLREETVWLHAYESADGRFRAVFWTSTRKWRVKERREGSKRKVDVGTFTTADAALRAISERLSLKS